MNERLAKLTEQCYEYNETMQSAWFNKTKFAELLIKECARVADLADENGCEWIGGNILTHFGVEE